MRIGHGYDVHRFDPESAAGDIKLGGVLVPSTHSLLAHSDGDVVLHALCDALLGAIGEGDIGEHFPDTSSDWKNADSRVLLRHVFSLVEAKGYELGNADLTIAAQTPKLQAYKKTMAETIAVDLKTDVENVNVKATTTEKLGFVGRKEGIAVDAVVLIKQGKV